MFRNMLVSENANHNLISADVLEGVCLKVCVTEVPSVSVITIIMSKML